MLSGTFIKRSSIKGCNHRKDGLQPFIFLSEIHSEMDDKKIAKLFIVNEMHLNMGFRCILFICSIKYTEIEKKISKFVLF